MSVAIRWYTHMHSFVSICYMYATMGYASSLWAVVFVCNTTGTGSHSILQWLSLFCEVHGLWSEFTSNVCQLCGLYTSSSFGELSVLFLWSHITLSLQLQAQVSCLVGVSFESNSCRPFVQHLLHLLVALSAVLGIGLVYAYWDLTFMLRDYLACMPYAVGSMHWQRQCLWDRQPCFGLCIVRFDLRWEIMLQFHVYWSQWFHVHLTIALHLVAIFPWRHCLLGIAVSYHKLW